MTMWGVWAVCAIVLICCVDGGSLRDIRGSVNRGPGEVLSWGDNKYGQLGFLLLGGQPVSEIHYPATIETFRPLPVMDSVGVGVAHTIFLTREGVLYGCGSNSYGQMGVGDFNKRNGPTELATLTGKGVHTLAVASYHNLVVNAEGRVFAWGLNIFGQLGVNHTSHRSDPTRVQFPYYPLLPDPLMKTVAAGYSHSLAIAVGGELFAWGDNYFGQLGLGDFARRIVPTWVTALRGHTVVSIACGDFHSLVLTSDGLLFSFGLNKNGQLGLKDTTDRNIPTLVPKPPPGKWLLTSISAGAFNSFAITDHGDLYGWGSNRYGQLLLNFTDFAPHPIPQRLSFFERSRGLKILTGGYSCMAIKADNSVWMWGLNEHGQLGLGDPPGYHDTPEGAPHPPLPPVLQPVAVRLTASNVYLAQAGLGQGHAVVVFESGEGLPCGPNLFGEFVCGTAVYDSPTSTTDVDEES